MAEKLYKLSDGDWEIIRASYSEDDPNRFTNFYMRGEHSGTYWSRVTEKDIKDLKLSGSKEVARKWRDGYNTIRAIWDHLGKPLYFAPDPANPNDWHPLPEREFALYRQRLDRAYKAVRTLDPEHPRFFHPHGVQLIGWQKEMHRSRQAVQVVVGGFGSGKTWAKLISMLYSAATLPGYRAFALAPYSIQSTEVFRQAQKILKGTEFARRFLIKMKLKPFPHIMIGNEYVGVNTIECYPILDNSEKILTLEGDEALVDQSEQMDNLDEVVRNIGSRFRGLSGGRERKGQISLVANSAENPQLWDWFDEGATDPEYVWAHSPGTFDNIHLTIPDLKRFERQVGRDEQSRRVHLMGERPIGSGEHFPYTSLTAAKADWMDELMSSKIDANVPGWQRVTVPRAGVHKWQRPPEEGQRYIVAADAGWANPPERNSAVIGVWRITNFPRTPAQLDVFHWVFGNGDPNPWLNSFYNYAIEYKAVGLAGFDATGFQSGYERMVDMQAIKPVPVSLAGNNKYTYLNLAKKFMADGLFQVPGSLSHFFSQHAKYTLPDTKLRQDIVMMVLVGCALLEPFYYAALNEIEVQTGQDFDRFDRNARPIPREWENTGGKYRWGQRTAR